MGLRDVQYFFEESNYTVQFHLKSYKSHYPDMSFQIELLICRQLIFSPLPLNGGVLTTEIMHCGMMIFECN